MAQHDAGDHPGGLGPGGYGQLLGLLVIVALVVVALLMVRGLHQSSHDGDCLMQGRSDCNSSITAPSDR